MSGDGATLNESGQGEDGAQDKNGGRHDGLSLLFRAMISQQG